MTKQFEDPLAVWKELRGNTAKSRKIRRDAWEFFRTAFPYGHRTSIRNFVEEYEEMAKNGATFTGAHAHINDIHPRAFALFLKHGKDYTPHLWKGDGPRTWKNQPTLGACFVNSFELMWVARKRHGVAESRATYVEGIATGPFVMPMLHAWNGFGFSRRAFDWTFYADRWIRYFGIPFTYEEYEYARQAAHPKPRIHLLFHKNLFERMEKRILEILERPRTRYPVASPSDPP